MIVSHIKFLSSQFCFTTVDKSNSLSMSVKLACSVFKIIILLMREVARLLEAAGSVKQLTQNMHIHW